nr:unnamed protein product [Spirometra erinaceieuropaei]
MAIDDKLSKEMSLERLPTSVQTVLDYGSDDLDISKLSKMADHMMEVERLSPTAVAQIFQRLSVSTYDLAELKTQIAQVSATVAALRLRQSAGQSRSSFGRDRRRSRSRPRTTYVCWCHVNFDEKARRYVPPCSLKSSPGNSSVGGRLFPWIFVVADIPTAILAADFLAAFDLLVAAVRYFPPPSSKRQLQRFLGMVNFYRRFLPNCADTILPLTSLLAGSRRTFELTPAALTSLEQVKALLADVTLLTHFHADALISLMVCASSVAVGAALQQRLLDSTVPSVFFSRKLSKTEARYGTFGRERHAVCLAQSELERAQLDKEAELFEKYLDGTKKGTLTTAIKSERINIVWHLLNHFKFFERSTHFGGPDIFADIADEWPEFYKKKPIYFYYNEPHDKAIKEYLKGNYTTGAYMKHLGLTIMKVIRLIRDRKEGKSCFSLLTPFIASASSYIIDNRGLRDLFERGGFTVTDANALRLELKNTVTNALEALLSNEPATKK